MSNLSFDVLLQTPLFTSIQKLHIEKSNFSVTVDGKSRGVASSESQGGPEALFCPTFWKIHFLLHFYVTIFWDFKSQGGAAAPPPGPPSYDAPARPQKFTKWNF